jgi:DNA-binding MarR family transcriptional regulator
MSSETHRPLYELRVLEALRRIIRATDLHSRQLLLRHRITTPQLLALRLVVERRSLTVSCLSRAMHLSGGTVVGILNRLEERLLIRRERNLKDRRVVHVTPTDLGESLIRTAPSPLQTRLAEALSHLPELEQSTIALSLERVVDLMEAGGLEASPILELGSTLDGSTGSPPGDLIRGELSDDSAAKRETQLEDEDHGREVPR